MEQEKNLGGIILAILFIAVGLSLLISPDKIEELIIAIFFFMGGVVLAVHSA